MKDYLEKRIFTLFFAVTFILILSLVLLSWQIIRYGIRQREDKELSDITNKVSERLSQHHEDVMLRLNDISTSESLKDSFRKHDIAALREIIIEKVTEKESERMFFFCGNRDVIIGTDYQPLQDYLLMILHRSNQTHRTYYFNTGYEIFTVYLSTIIDIIENDSAILGYMFYLQKLDRSVIKTDQNDAYIFSDVDDLHHTNLSDRYRNMVSNKILSLRSRSLEDTQKRFNLRQGIDTAGSLMVYYGFFSRPELFIFIPYDRQLNQFAHQGLLVFMLTLSALAIIMITIAGAWFKSKIIAPVKAVNIKMRQIENNPLSIQPLFTNYRGILGDMVEIFNSMISSIASHTYSLKAYKTITDNLDSAVIWMDNDMKIILCNPATAEIFDLDDPKKIIDKNLQELLHISTDEIKLTSQKRVFKPNLILSTEKGNKYLRFVLFSLSSFDSDTGINYIASIYDITKETKESLAREKLELELIKSNRLADLGRLTEGVVHNINSPLNSIMGYAQLIQKTDPDNYDLKKIINASSTISLLVKKLLYKVREDSISMHRPIDINHLIEMELEMCRHNIFFSQNVKLIKNLTKTNGKVFASHGEISISIANIINNAIQSMKCSPKKVLTIETLQDKNTIIISISDTGCGIPPENIDKIFRPDFSTRRSSDSSGFGLGLAISKSIVEKYKGSLELTSDTGIGTTFKISLPLQNIIDK